MTDSERIGDPTKEKWTEFLAKCLEKGIISTEEFTDRIGILLAAKTSGEFHPACDDLPWKPWNEAWNKQREKGLRSKTEILPDKPSGKILQQEMKILQQEIVRLDNKLLTWQIASFVLAVACIVIVLLK